MRVIVLGCGGSGGVPLIGNDWGACNPDNPRNRRRRVSILVQERGTNLLVDTSPDVREQLLDAGAEHVDAVLYTHAHADHLHGIDDLRAVNRRMGRPIPVYGAPEALDEIAVRFSYVFAPNQPGLGGPFYKPALVAHRIDGPFVVGGIAVQPFQQDHGFSTTLGFRFGKLAYSTDVVELDETAFATLAGIEVWIVDCLRLEPHQTHSHLEKTLAWIDRVRPRRAVLTHMDQNLDYDVVRGLVPDHVEPGYDGLIIDL